MLGSPIRLSDSAPRHERAPPTLGQHDDEITHLLGIDPVPLRAAGAMR
jgi:crotonobetainyl-CoA:carnitine CoA-transferase CaiB-like acyl-CoA transferase